MDSMNFRVQIFDAEGKFIKNSERSEQGMASSLSQKALQLTARGIFMWLILHLIIFRYLTQRASCCSF